MLLVCYNNSFESFVKNPYAHIHFQDHNVDGSYYGAEKQILIPILMFYFTLKSHISALNSISFTRHDFKINNMKKCPVYIITYWFNLVIVSNLQAYTDAFNTFKKITFNICYTKIYRWNKWAIQNVIILSTLIEGTITW